MTDTMKVIDSFKVGNTVSSSGNSEPAALGKDRTLLGRDWILQGKLEGRMFHAQQGDAGTKLDWAEVAYDEDQPQFALRVPDGTVCIPLAMNITIEDIPGTEDFIIWSVTSNDIGAGTSTSLTVQNNRGDKLKAPTCKANSLYTQNATAATDLHEVKRWYHPFGSAAVTDGMDLQNHNWTINDPDMPILVGPATLQCHIYAATDCPQGFGEYMWLEYSAEELGL